MHLSNKQGVMNKTFTILTNEHRSFHHNVEHNQSTRNLENTTRLSATSDNNRFRTFTKCKIQQHPATVIVNRYQQRYFDSPTMITLDDDDDIPVVRCSNTTPIAIDPEPNLDETELSDLLVFTNPNRILSESMHVVISRHPSLQDLNYINDVSSILVVPPLFIQDKEEHVYQELIRIDRSITTPPTDYMNDIDENKENRPPLMPIKCQVSRIPVWTPPPDNKKINIATTTSKSKKYEGVKKKTTKSGLGDLLDEWSCVLPKLKNLLSNTRKMPLRMPELSSNNSEFRRLKQLLNELEGTTSSWTNAMNQCRYVLQHAQQQSHRS